MQTTQECKEKEQDRKESPACSRDYMKAFTYDTSLHETYMEASMNILSIDLDDRGAVHAAALLHVIRF